MLFVSIVSFFIFFNTNSFNQNQKVINSIKNDTYSISIPYYVNRDNKNRTLDLHNLKKDGITIIKEKNTVLSNLTTFDITDNKINNKLIQNLPSGSIQLNHLKKLKYNDLIGQHFYVKLKNNFDSNNLKNNLAKAFKMSDSSIHIDYYNTPSKAKSYPNNIQIISILIFSISLLIIIYVFEYFLSYKEFNMYLVFGYSKWNILNKYIKNTLRQVIFPIIAILIMVMYCYLSFKSTDNLLVLNVGISTIKFLFMTVVVSLITFAFLISLFSPDEQYLKGKYPFRSIMIFNSVVKVLLMISLILISQSILPQIKNTIIITIQRNQTMGFLKGYNNLPLKPSIKAMNFEVNHLKQFNKNNQKFLNNLYDKKLIIFSPSNETFHQLSSKGKTSIKNIESNIVYISPEYLNSMDIKDNKNKVLKINNNANHGLILLPNAYSRRENKVKKVVNTKHRDDIKDIYLEGKSKKISNYDSSPKLKYIGIKDNQKLIKFYDYYSGLKNPILIVVTKPLINYPYSFYASDITGSSNNYFFKSSNQDTNKIIEKSRLKEYYPKIINAQERINDNFNNSVLTTAVEGTIGLTLLISFIIVSIFSIWTKLLADRKLLLTKKIFGYKLKNIFCYRIIFILLLWTIVYLYETIAYSDIVNNFYLFMGVTDLVINIASMKIYFNKLGRK